MECIGRTGTFPKEVTISDIRKERDGFLKIFTFASSDADFRLDAMHRGDAVFVLPVDLERGKVYLVRQPRHLLAFQNENIESANQSQGLWGGSLSVIFPFEQILAFDVPAETLESGEIPIQGALRGMQKEMGMFLCQESDLTSYGATYSSIGGSTERLHLFVAEVGGFGECASVHPRGDGTERLEVWKMSFKEAFGLLENGQIINSGGRILLEAFWRRLVQRHLDGLANAIGLGC